MIAKVPVSLEGLMKFQGMTAVRLVGQAGGFLPRRQSLDNFFLSFYSTLLFILF